MTAFMLNGFRMEKICQRIIGYEEDKYGFESPVGCGKKGIAAVDNYIESPFMRNHWQVVPYFPCEDHLQDSVARSEARKQKILDNGGKFVRIEAGNRNQLKHIELNPDDC